MGVCKAGTRVVLALILCNWSIHAKDAHQDVALQIQPLAPGYIITAKLVCGSGYNECVKEAARTKVWVCRLTVDPKCDAAKNGPDSANERPEPFVVEHIEGKNDRNINEHSLKYTLRGNPLRSGDRVRLQYPQGEYSAPQTVLLSDEDFKTAVQLDAVKHIVTVYFPSSQPLTMRLEDANGLNRRWKVKPDPTDGQWAAAFNGIPDGKGVKLVFSVGEPPDRRDYPAIPIPDGPGGGGDALSRTGQPEQSASVQSVAFLPARQNSISPAARFQVQQALLHDPVLAPQPAPAPPADTPPSPSPPAKLAAPDTVIQIVEGVNIVTGYDKRFEKVRVDVMEREEVVEHSEAAVDKDTGKFTATLTQPVGADQTVMVYGLKGPDVSEPKSLGVLPAEMDWGRVRAYFTLGLLISAPGSNQLNTSTANPFVALTVDKNWLRPRVRMQGVRLNTFFDARLTSIAAVADAGKTTTPPTPTSPLANKHAGSLQVGGYLPVILTNYFFRNHQYSLFTAPLAKFGFYQLTDSTTDASGITTINNASFYKFHAYGLRVGHYREYVDWQGRGNTHHSPEQLSYIDFTMGKWGNFEYVKKYFPDAAHGGVCTADSAETGTSSCAVLRQQAWRLGVEGMLRIPFTPFILGLNANISTQRLHLPGYIAPGDDLRFLFGMRFDSRKLLNGIAKIGGN